MRGRQRATSSAACRAALSVPVLILGLLHSGTTLGQGVSPAEARYRLVYTASTVVTTAVFPFSADQQVGGYLALPSEARRGLSFYRQKPPNSARFPLPAVNDFLFSIASFEWTPVDDHAVLGTTDPGGVIHQVVMGFERDACQSLSPCFLDIVTNNRGTLNVEIYQPASGNTSEVVGYRAEGVQLLRQQ